jgi:hypothetical protein
MFLLLSHFHPDLEKPETHDAQLVWESVQVLQGEVQLRHWPEVKPSAKVNPSLQDEQTD